MEIVARDLKLQGIFLARQLSFKGVEFQITNVEMDLNHKETYDRSVKLWVKMKDYINAVKRINPKQKNFSMEYWRGHQRFFRYLCIAAKIDETVLITNKAVQDGKSVVIGLQTTGHIYNRL